MGTLPLNGRALLFRLATIVLALGLSLALALITVPVSAEQNPNCEIELGLNGFEITAKAERQRVKHRIDPSSLLKLAINATNYFAQSPNLPMDYFVSYLSKDKFDVGYRLNLSPAEILGQWRINSVKPVRDKQEKVFFKDLVKNENIETINIRLAIALLSFKKLTILPHVQIKIREKHALQIHEIREAFTQRKTKLKLEQASENPKYADSPRYGFYGLTNAGKWLKIVITTNREKTELYLITAYQERTPKSDEK
jgi:hypothetical protein